MTKTIKLDGNVFFEGSPKIVCVGRNYADHAKEMNSPVPKEPILFIKPASTLVPFTGDIRIPKHLGSVHHELEIALLVGKTLKNADQQTVMDSIAGIGLGLDLTLRDLQKTLKEKGHPWERAKAFDDACPLSDFMSLDNVSDVLNEQAITFDLIKNGNIQQQGNSAEMIFSMVELCCTISQFFTLEKGDIILTGTPSGVGELNAGDQLTANLSINNKNVIRCEGTITH